MQLPDLSQRTSWPPPNYSNPEMRKLENLIITAALLPMVLFVMGRKIFSRLKYYGYWGFEDSLMITNLALTSAYAFLGLFWDLTTGWRHIWDYPIAKLVLGRQVDLTSKILFILAATIIQISILIFIRRLLPSSEVIMNNLILIMVLVIAIQALVFIFLELFQCHHIPDYWIPSVQSQRCIKEPPLLLAAGISQSVTTLTLLFIYLLKYNQTSVVLIATGATMLLAGAFRTYYLFHASNTSDQFWNSYPAWVAGSIELYAGAICVSSFPFHQFITRTSSPFRDLPIMVNNQQKDEPAYIKNSPTLGRANSEQNPDMYTSPNTSFSTEIESIFVSPPPIIYDHTQGGRIIRYLPSTPEKSTVLSSIKEESMLSNKPAPLRKAVKPFGDHSSIYSSDCSSISSFNVAFPACEFNRPISITFNSGHLSRTRHYSQTPLKSTKIISSRHESSENSSGSNNGVLIVIGHNDNCNPRKSVGASSYLTCSQMTQASTRKNER